MREGVGEGIARFGAGAISFLRNDRLTERLFMSTYEARLAALRDQLKADRLHGFVVPICDEHMSEYVGAYAQRLAWLTGFGGSAGTAVVLSEDAAIFVDGRYTIQVREQVDGRHWSYQSTMETSVSDWLGAHAAEGARIGYDPWVHTKTWVEAATKALAAKGASARAEASVASASAGIACSVPRTFSMAIR